jgi:hypothetical protein
MSGHFRSASHIERNWIGRDHQPNWLITKASPAEKLLMHESPSVYREARARQKGVA